MKDNKTNMNTILESANKAFNENKIDRTKHVGEISECLTTLGENDLRIGQVFEIIRSKFGNDLFNVENDKLLELFQELISTSDK